MTKRLRRVLLSVLVIGGLQGVLWLAYGAATGSRPTMEDVSVEAPTGRVAPMQASLLQRDAGATTLAVLSASRPVLLHFWATWCAPCQDELPALLEMEQPEELQVVLVTLDQEWPAVEAFFDGAVPALVLRDGGKLAAALEVSTLPDTYLLRPDGTQLARFHGARDWSSPVLTGELARLLHASR